MLHRLFLAASAAAAVIAGAVPAFAQTAPATTATHTAQPLLKAEYFARDPDMSPPQISPDGTHLVYVRGTDIVIYDIADESEKTLWSGGKALMSANWIGNDYAVAYLKPDRVEDKRGVAIQAFSPLIVTKDAKFVRELFAQDCKKMTAMDLRPIARFVDGPHPYAITLGFNTTATTDIVTGVSKPGPKPMDGAIHEFDSKGHERLAIDPVAGKSGLGVVEATLHYRATPDGAVQSLHVPRLDKTYYTGFHYAEADNAIYFSQFDHDKNVASIFRFDMASQAQSLVKTAETKDLDLIFDKAGHAVGSEITTDRPQTEWSDAYYLKLTAAVQKVFPKATVAVVDATADKQKVVLWVSSPEAPDSYYYYDADSQYLIVIGTAYPELDGQPLGEMTYVTYKARDGLDIPAYVTKRKDTPAGAPLIVLPHDGPAARDVYGFNFMAQFLASRGYVVLQPQYRGSEGFGEAFERAGDLHLDQMTNDLEDGVKYLAGQGTIDPKRVCIVGWSWGGYLADAGVTLAPGTYACGVAGGGISDLYQLLSEENDIYWGGYGISYLHTLIGRQFLDDTKLLATSPILHVKAARAPLLLIHGDLDNIIAADQSEGMNTAMQKAGKSVTDLPVKYMRHVPETDEQRLQVLEAMDSFIADAFAHTDKGTTAAK